MKILAVDDDPLILELLGSTLGQIGYTDLTTAKSATEAAQIISAAPEPFDCFLLDIQMPGIDGIELCRWIRKGGRYRTAPILMITAMADKSYVDRAFVAGATDYVTKPFDPTELTTRIRVAERQFIADRRLKDDSYAIHALRAQIEDSYKVALSEPVTLDDVEGLIDMLALENYLLQLSRGDLVATSVIALHIHEVGHVYSRCSASLYRDVLADVAESALASLTGTECLLAHAGNGTFAGVLSHAAALDVQEVELVINGILSRLELVDDKDQPLDVRVAVGVPVHIGFMKSGRGAINMLHRAIDDILWATPRSESGQEPQRRSRGSLLGALASSF